MHLPSSPDQSLLTNDPRPTTVNSRPPTAEWRPTTSRSTTPDPRQSTVLNNYASINHEWLTNWWLLKIKYYKNKIFWKISAATITTSLLGRTSFVHNLLKIKRLHVQCPSILTLTSGYNSTYTCYSGTIPCPLNAFKRVMSMRTHSAVFWSIAPSSHQQNSKITVY